MKKAILLIISFVVVSAVIFFLVTTPGKKYSYFTPDSTADSNPPTTTLFFGGDIMLSRNVHTKISTANDYTLPFKQIADKISKADIAFGNLESPFWEKGPYFVDHSLVFDADPKSVLGLNFAGFDILSTANNHSFDQGKQGVEFTIEHLTENKILPLGTGTDCHVGQQIERNGMKFGFLAYSYTAYNNGGNLPDPQVCDANDLAKVKIDIATMRPKVDFLVVSTHMGTEYTRTPSQSQVDFAHQAVDAGADLVIGNHPHWVQTIEQYRGKWIFYAMGNLVFDQMWSQDTREGLTATVTFENKIIKKIQLDPVIIDNYCCPRWASETETKSILSKINLTSQNLFVNKSN